MTKKTSKKIKKIAKTTAGAVGGAVIGGASAALDVALAPVYIVGSAAVSGFNGARVVNHKDTLDQMIEKKRQKLRKK